MLVKLSNFSKFASEYVTDSVTDSLSFPKFGSIYFDLKFYMEKKIDIQ